MGLGQSWSESATLSNRSGGKNFNQTAKVFIVSWRLICLRCHPVCDDLLKCWVVHKSNKYLLILVHTFNEQLLQQIPEYQLKLIAGIDCRSLPQTGIGHCRLNDLIEEEK
jgi:hypothetical protein